MRASPLHTPRRRRAMVIGLSIHTFTIAHVVISLVAIASGLIVLFGMLGAHRLPAFTALCLVTTILTSVTGFMFPIHSRARRRRCFDVGVGSRADCSICEAFSRIVAVDIRRHRRFSALFQCAGFDRS